MSPESRNIFPLALCVCLLAANLAFFAFESNQIIQNDLRQEVIDRFLKHLNLIQDGLQNAETGQRGYLLTGEASYLVPYVRGTEVAKANFRVFAALAADHGVSDRDLDDLERMMRAKLTELEQTITLRQDKSLADALAVVKTGEGKRYMEEFQHLATGMFAAIRNEQLSLYADNAHRIAVAKWSFLSLAAIITVVLILGQWMLSKSMKKARELQNQLEKEATHDYLTRLPNRMLAMQWADAAQARAIRAGAAMAVLFVDLDGFKAVNDTLGHEAGDRVLIEVAKRFSALVRKTDLLCRLGGDEFAVIAEQARDPRELSRLAERLIAALNDPIVTGAGECRVGASVGIAVSTRECGDVSCVFNAADAAMYEAKKAGKGRYVFAGSGPA